MLMNRIESRFDELKSTGKKGFVAYIGAGDPNIDATLEIAKAMDRSGVDILEMGVPFSDPLADGVVNQLAAQRGLLSGTTPEKIFQCVSKLRKDSELPIVLYVYFNLLHRIGLESFIQKASQSGVDGLLVLDLPPEESENYESVMKQHEMCPIYLIAPTTPESRIKAISARASGFIYYVSREGVTGMQQTISTTISEMTNAIRQHTKLPIAVGFGISNEDQAKEVAQNSEAIVVGSAIVNQIAKNGESSDLPEKVEEFVTRLVQATKSVQ